MFRAHTFPLFAKHQIGTLNGVARDYHIGQQAGYGKRLSPVFLRADYSALPSHAVQASLDATAERQNSRGAHHLLTRCGGGQSWP